MVTVGAVLKKIAIGLLSHPKSWKVVGGIVLGLIVILVTPLAMITAVFNGDIEIDRDRLNEIIERNMTAEQSEKAKTIDKTMTEIEKQLNKKKLSEYRLQAEVVYAMALADKSSESNFVQNFLGCFKKGQSDAEFVKKVNEKFGVAISYEEFSTMMNSVQGGNSG